MLSLAPIKYRNILKENGGPLEKITWSRAQISFETEGYEASCFLSCDLKKGAETYSLYSNADGTGSDSFKSIACYKAISEALERWAYYEILWSARASEYKFNIDPSTTGMAAFPGFTNSYTIEHAKNEALERWVLVEWWAGNLRAKKVSLGGIESLEILIPGHGVVCISWIFKNEKWAYGFAAGSSFESAFKKAQIELFRNEYVLSNFEGRDRDLNPQEQRVLYFSSQIGHESFLGVVEKSLSSNKIKSPLLILNKEVVGPWSRYATVWRVLYQTGANVSGNMDVDCFLF